MVCAEGVIGRSEEARYAGAVAEGTAFGVLDYRSIVGMRLIRRLLRGRTWDLIRFKRRNVLWRNFLLGYNSVSCWREILSLPKTHENTATLIAQQASEWEGFW